MTEGRWIYEAVLSMIETRQFELWHNWGRFEEWVSGENPELNREDILQDIEEMMTRGKKVDDTSTAPPSLPTYAHR